MSNGTAPEAPAVVRRVTTPPARSLVALVEVFDELQTVLRCCERLVEELKGDAPDALEVEALWTVALLSYARCFAEREGGAVLTEADLTEALPDEQVLTWHRMLARLRDHHAAPAEDPRERFSVGATQGADGRATGVAITSTRQPLVDDLTVRQTGAIAFALSGLVDRRIGAQQEQVSAELAALTPAELGALETIDVEPAAPPGR